jgi:hypothetical protein
MAHFVCLSHFSVRSLFFTSFRFSMDRLKIVSYRMMMDEQGMITTKEKTQNRSCPLYTCMVKLCHTMMITIDLYQQHVEYLIAS